MKSAVFLLCLLLATRAGAADPSVSKSTGSQRPRATPEYRIREVRFAGDPAFDTDALTKVLKEPKARRWIPGVWTRRPRYDARSLDADLARLRSFYLSNGYFDARVEIEEVTFDGREATITLRVQSGPKSRVRPVNIEGFVNGHGTIVSEPNGDFPVEQVCKSLLDAKRMAEAHGRIDFAAGLEISDVNRAAPGSESNWVDVTARVRTGSPYVVGRISFSGHHRINDSTLRRAMVLQETGLFDVGKLRRSLAGLNRSGLIEPITADDVEIHVDPSRLTADVRIPVREPPRGHWWLSGPVVVTRLTESLRATISSRLPPWGRGVFEASTYYVTFSMIGLPNPLVRLLPFAPTPRMSPLLALERPYLPGQAVFSGFALSPRRPARTMLTSYAVTHLSRGALSSDSSVPATLLVEVETSHASVDGERSSVGFLICERAEPRLRWLRRSAAYAADVALSAFRPF